VDGKSKTPQYVVTVLRGMEPIAVCTVTAISPNSNDVEVIISPSASYGEISEVIGMVVSSCQYLIWKETGQLPPPSDFHPAVESPVDPPF